MGTTINFVGTDYTIPAVGEVGWGLDVTNYLLAISTSVLTRSGGQFTLTSNVNFGPTFGLETAFIQSRLANPATAGIARLANTDSIQWRNAAATGNLVLDVLSSSDRLAFEGSELVDVSTSQTLFNKTLSSANLVNATITGGTITGLTISSLTGLDVDGNTQLGNSSGDTLTVDATSTFNAPVTLASTLQVSGASTLNNNLTVNGNTILDGTLTVSSTLTLSALTASRAIVTNSSSQAISSATTATQIGYLSNTTSDIQAQINSKENTFNKGDLSETGSSILTITNGSSRLVGSSSLTLEVAQATSSVSGYLSSTDWNTFNDKAPINSPSFTGTVTIGSSGSTLTHTINGALQITGAGDGNLAVISTDAFSSLRVTDPTGDVRLISSAGDAILRSEFNGDMYFVSDFGAAGTTSDFIWKTDVTGSDPAATGTELMRLNDSGVLSVTGQGDSTTRFQVGGSVQLGLNGASAQTTVLFHGVTDGRILLSGSTGSSDGGQIALYGGAHASQANDIEFYGDATNVVYHYDHSADSHIFAQDSAIGRVNVLVTGGETQDNGSMGVLQIRGYRADTGNNSTQVEFFYGNSSASRQIGEFRFKNTTANTATTGGELGIATSDTSGTLIDAIVVDESQAVTLGASGGTQTHTINGAQVNLAADNSGGIVGALIENTSTDAANSRAELLIKVDDNSTGSPRIRFQAGASGNQYATIGVDADDSDIFKINRGNGFSGSPIEIDTSNNITLAANDAAQVVNIGASGNTATHSFTGSLFRFRDSTATTRVSIDPDGTPSIDWPSTNAALNSVSNAYINIDSNNSSTANEFVVAHNAEGNAGTELFVVQEDGQSNFSGRLGVSGAAGTAAHVIVRGTQALTSNVTNIGFYSFYNAPSNATSSIEGFRSQTSTADASFTASYLAQFYSLPIAKGAASTITRKIQYLGSGSSNDDGTHNAFMADNLSFTGDWFLNSTNTNPSLFSGPLTFGNASSRNLVNTINGEFYQYAGVSASSTIHSIAATHSFNVSTGAEDQDIATVDLSAGGTSDSVIIHMQIICSETTSGAGEVFDVIAIAYHNGTNAVFNTPVITSRINSGSFTDVTASWVGSGDSRTFRITANQNSSTYVADIRIGDRVGNRVTLELSGS